MKNFLEDSLQEANSSLPQAPKMWGSWWGEVPPHWIQISIILSWKRAVRSSWKQSPNSLAALWKLVPLSVYTAVRSPRRTVKRLKAASIAGVLKSE